MVFIHEPHLPSLAECPCTLSPCPRCEQGRGVSRGSGFGLAVAFWPSLEHHRPKSGVASTLTWRGWISCSWSPLASGRADFLPERVERLLHWVEASPHGGLSRGTIFTAWRRWELGRPCWREPEYEPVLGLRGGGAVVAGQALWHWLGGLAGGVEFWAWQQLAPWRRSMGSRLGWPWRGRFLDAGKRFGQGLCCAGRQGRRLRLQHLRAGKAPNWFRPG